MSVFPFSKLKMFILLGLAVFAAAGQSAPENSASALEQAETEARTLGLQWNLAANQRAIALFDETSGKWRARKKPERAAACLLDAGRQAIISGDKNQARRFFDRALIILAESDLPALESRVRSELSILAIDQGEMPEAERNFEKALVLAERSGDLTAMATAHYAAAEFYYFKDLPEKALVSYQKSMGFWSQTGDAAGEARTRLGLGYLYLLQSDFQASLETLQTALLKFQQARDARGEAFSLKALGSVYKKINDYPKSIAALQQAEQLFPADLDFNEKAMLFNWFGSLYEDYGDWKLSAAYRAKALKLFARDRYVYGQMATLTSLGRLSNLLGDGESALRYIEQAEIFARKLNDKFYMASIDEEKSNVYVQKNDLEKASVTLEQALALYDKRLYQRQIARVNNKLGWILERQNRFSDAARYLNESLELSRKVKDNLGESQTLFSLARLRFSENETDAALDFARQSIEKTESSSYDLNSKLKTLYFSNVDVRYELYIRLLMQLHARSPEAGYAVEALQAAEKSRARVMLENISLSAADFTRDADAATVARENEIRVRLNAKADKLTDLLSQNAAPSETEKISFEIGALENELEDIKARLKQQSPVYSAIKNPAPFDVRDFQRNTLDENSLLLEFSFGSEASYLWAVDRETVAAYVLPPRAEIETSVADLRRRLNERAMLPGEEVQDFQKRIAQSEAMFETEAAELSRKLFGQVAGRLNGKRLIIVPDGALHYFPVAALPLPGAVSGEPILLTNETVYEPSAQTLAVLAGSRRPSVPAKDLLVFSDPVFTTDDARLTNRSAPIENPETVRTERFRFAESLNNLPRLASSKDESETIAETVGAANIENYTGFAATREKLLSLKTEDYKILHFATHGLIDEKRPELSGIVLSRFDENGRQLNEFFRTYDIFGLKLNADLVVLSACETGIGKEVRGEGMRSLNNAFLQTGAKTVMASLWKVEDGATLELMRNFYGALAGEGLTPSQSLRRAQLRLRENPQYRSPFYWAAFTVQGDFRSVPKLSGEPRYWAYLLPLPPLAFLLFYLFRRQSGKTR